MKKYWLFWISTFLIATVCRSQNNLIAFYEYQIKDGVRGQFVDGYAKDLQWHQSQGDNWAWIGWFVANGERRGRFIDATPNHTWKDFDNWKVDAAENARQNQLNWAPYITNASGSYKKILPAFSQYETNWYTNNFLQVYHFQLKPGKEMIFRKFLENFNSSLNEKTKTFSIVWMKTVSGGSNTYHLFIGFNKMDAMEKLEDLFLFSDSQTKSANLFSQSVTEIKNELWRHNERLTYIPKKGNSDN